MKSVWANTYSTTQKFSGLLPTFAKSNSSMFESGATIYYTTDGTVPTEKSTKYTGSILVSGNTTIKAIAIKDGYINSAYGSAVIKIDGDTVQSSDNLAVSSIASASSDQGDTVSASKTNDGNGSTRWQAKADDGEYLQLNVR